MVSKYIEKLQLEIRDQDMEIHRLKGLLTDAYELLDRCRRKAAIDQDFEELMEKLREILGLEESNESIR